MSTNSSKTNSWGNWVERRARHVGIRRLLDLALAIGCHQNHVTRFVQSEQPPKRMTKGFDAALVEALRTDRYTLFAAWRDVAPEDAPLVDPLTRSRPDEPAVRRKVLAIVELLGPDQLTELHDKGRQLLAASSAA